MNNKVKQIRLTTDKNGKVIAHEWRNLAMRYVKVCLEEARLLIATGQAVQIYKDAR